MNAIQVYMQQIGLDDEPTFIATDKGSLMLAMAIENATGRSGFPKTSPVYYQLLGKEVVKQLVQPSQMVLRYSQRDERYYFTDRAWKAFEEQK